LAPWLKPTVAAIAAVFSLLVAVLTVGWFAVAGFRRLKREAVLWRRIGTAIRTATRIEQLAERLFEIVGDLMDARGYYLYVADGKDADTLILKAARHAAEEAKVRASYSGLLAGGHEVYSPPLSHEARSQPLEVAFVNVSGASMLAVPLIGENDSMVGVMHVGPVARHRVPRPVLDTLRSISPALGSLTGVTLERLRLHEKLRETVGYAEASLVTAKGALEPVEFVEMFLRIGARLVEADAWLMVVFEGRFSRNRLPSCEGVPSSLAERAIRGLEEAWHLRRSPRPPVQVFDRGSAGDGVLGALIRETGSARAICLALGEEGSLGGLVYLLKKNGLPDVSKMHALEAIAGQIGIELEGLRLHDRIEVPYVKALKTAVLAMDSKDPYSVGHSARVSKYAREIAEEMGLDRNQVEGIALAAYLHDIGMAALEWDLVFKDAPYAPSEYEAMKAHAGIGAAFVQPIRWPVPLAPLVRHHHERYDGLGYPDGLKGDAIPLGARIIAVADTFNAKVSARRYRRALPFWKALEDIRVASGTQLDPQAVSALVRVFARKRADRDRRGKALEPCWETLACTRAVRERCPAGGGDHRCWEMEGVMCHLHGGECSQCIVFTEYEDRLKGRNG